MLTVPPQSNSDPELGVSLCLQSGRPWRGHAQEQGNARVPEPAALGVRQGQGQERLQPLPSRDAHEQQQNHSLTGRNLSPGQKLGNYSLSSSRGV